MDDEQKRTYLAFAIGEWDSAIGHLAAVEVMMPGFAAPYWGHRLSDELTLMCRRWPGGEQIRPENADRINEIVKEARQWLAEHTQELEDLLARHE